MLLHRIDTSKYVSNLISIQNDNDLEYVKNFFTTMTDECKVCCIKVGISLLQIPKDEISNIQSELRDRAV